jgi:hypothetical protein
MIDSSIAPLRFFRRGALCAKIRQTAASRALAARFEFR